MKKKVRIFLISLLSALSLTTVGVACGGTGETSSSGDASSSSSSVLSEPKEYEIVGFDVAESLEIVYGESYLITSPCVTDNYDNSIDCNIQVFDSMGNEVKLECYSFFAMDSNGYTIRYTVEDYDGKTHTRETKVTVKGSKELSVKGVQIYDVGETVSILPQSGLQDPTYAYEVRLDETPIDLTDVEGGKQFTAEKAGVYQAKITATAGEREISYAYEILVREQLEEGSKVVETYDEYWAKSRELASLGTYGWEALHTETTGVQNRLGEDAYLLKKTVGVGEMYTDARFYLNPRQSLEAYLAAAEEGYTSVSVWVYTPSAGEYKISVHRSLSAHSGGGGADVTLKQNTWTEVRMVIPDVVSNVWAGSFEDAYENYKTQVSYMLKIVGKEKQVPFEVYISDVYATKDNTAKANADAEKTVAVGAEVDFKNFVTADEAKLAYTVTDDYGNEYKLAEGEKFVPTHNGNYYASVFVNPINHTQASKTVKALLTATDGVTLSGTSLIKERTGETVRADFSDLNASMTHATAEITITDRKVTYYGEEYATDETGFTATKDGMYAVQYCGEYTLDGLACKSYQTLTVDVFSEESKYSVVTTDNMLLAYGWDATLTSSLAKSSIVEDGENGRVLQVEPTDAFTVSFLPTFSKHYYESMLSEDTVALVQTGTYVGANCVVLDWLASDGSNKSVAAGTWYSPKSTIENLIANYDEFVATYQTAKLRKAGWQTGAMRYEEYLLVNVWDNATADHRTGVCKIKEVDCIVRPKSESYTEEVEYLVDTKGLTSLEKLGSTVASGNNQKTGAEFLSQYASQTANMNYILENVVTGDSVTLTSLDEIVATAKGRYKLTVELDYSTLYTAPIDLYDSDEGFVWTDYSAKAYATGAPNNLGILIDTTGENLSGNFYKLGNNSGNLSWDTFTVKPLHSKAYYEGYADLAFRYTVGFVSADKTLPDEQISVKGYNQSVSTVLKNLQTTTVTVSMADILNAFASLTFVTKTAATATTDGWTYLGNFCAVEPVRVYTESTEYLLNKKDVTSFEKVGSATASGDNTLSGQAYLLGFAEETSQMSFLFVDRISEQSYTITDIAQISTLPSTRYTLTVKVGQDDVYVAPIDLYDSDEGFIWNEVLHKNYLSYGESQWSVQNSIKVVTKAENDEFFMGAGNYYSWDKTAWGSWAKARVFAQHSLAYYQAYETESLQFDVGFVPTNAEDTGVVKIVEMHGQTGTQTVLNPNEKKTLTVTVADLIENFESLHQPATQTGGKYFLLDHSGTAGAGTVYIGNFRLATNA